MLELIERIMPSLAPKVKLYDKEYPIFEEYGVQAEIDKALRSKVWLKSGGSIVINQTEALVAIDVNTGRYVGKKTAGRLEDTILKTNLEAVKEIVRQIRLRDLGGIIVLDFIDMEEKKNRQKVFQTVEQELRKDRAPSKALQVSDFGLVIITRKRVKQSLERVLTEPCPYCAGSAVIKSSSTICYEILSEVKKISADLDGQSLVLRVNPDIARALRDEERAVFKDLKQSLGREIALQAGRAAAPRAVRFDGDRIGGRGGRVLSDPPHRQYPQNPFTKTLTVFVVGWLVLPSLSSMTSLTSMFRYRSPFESLWVVRSLKKSHLSWMSMSAVLSVLTSVSVVDPTV